jgi:RNA polymerase sigma factor (sigma-70 family)
MLGTAVNLVNGPKSIWCRLFRLVTTSLSDFADCNCHLLTGVLSLPPQTQLGQLIATTIGPAENTPVFFAIDCHSGSVTKRRKPLMSHELLTQPSLLVRIRDPRNAAAWRQFVEIYAPLVYGFLRKHGLQDADAADVTQDVLRTVSQSIGQWNYDQQRGTFRGWLFSVVHSRLTDYHRRRRRQDAAVDAAASVLHPNSDGQSSTEWDRDYERQLFQAAAQAVRGDFSDSSWQAFWLAAVEGRSAHDIAAKLHITEAAVYLAKARVMARIRQQLELLIGEPE